MVGVQMHLMNTTCASMYTIHDVSKRDDNDTSPLARIINQLLTFP